MKYINCKSMFVFCFIMNIVGGIYARNAKTLERINVKAFGAKGNGSDDDTKAINTAFMEAAKKELILVFDKGVYLIDTISLRGEKWKPISALNIEGNNATLKSKTNTTNNIITLFFIDTVSIRDLTIIGNKQKQKNGNGIGVYYCKMFTLDGCSISNCELSGVMIAWAKNASITNNIIFNNGDGKLPSDGITVHSLEGGVIACNILHDNNPIQMQDGDGIQIGTIFQTINGYFDPNNIKEIKVIKNICYKHGRRGVKVQRSSVMVAQNFLSDNAIGVSAVRGDRGISSINIENNIVQKSYNGITTDGGAKIMITKSNISNNTLLGSILTDKILLKDASDITLSSNNFVNDLNQKNKELYYDVNVSQNSKSISLEQNDVDKVRLNNKNSFQISSAKNSVESKFKSKDNDLAYVNITDNKSVSISEDTIKRKDFFKVFTNNTSSATQINIIGKLPEKILLPKGKQLILYSCDESIKTFIY